jgi:hypothetical protein
MYDLDAKDYFSVIFLCYSFVFENPYFQTYKSLSVYIMAEKKGKCDLILLTTIIVLCVSDVLTVCDCPSEIIGEYCSENLMIIQVVVV